MQQIVIDPGGAMPSAGIAFVVPNSREAIEAAVDELIARLDAADGDIDLEDIDEREPDDDAKGDPSWTEWHTRGRHKTGTGTTGISGWQVHEDTEDDDPGGGNDDDEPHDPEQDCCTAGDDRICSGGVPGLMQSDHGYAGSDDDHESEQMLDDVPALNVVALEPNVFTGKRENLGFSNLMSSFVSNDGVRSADTGRLYRFHHSLRNEPGQPV